MVRMTFNARHLELTDAIKQYGEEKFHRLIAHYNFLKSIQIVLMVDHNPSVAQAHHADAVITLKCSGIVRVSAKAESLYAALDMLVDKAERSLMRYKGRNLSRTLHGHRGRSVSLRRQMEVWQELEMAEEATTQDDRMVS
jgi:putative sigma-54 modulation protein